MSNNTYDNIYESMKIIKKKADEYKEEKLPMKIKLVAASFHRTRALLAAISICSQRDSRNEYLFVNHNKYHDARAQNHKWQFNAEDSERADLAGMTEKTFLDYLEQSIGIKTGEIERIREVYYEGVLMTHSKAIFRALSDAGEWSRERVDDLRQRFLAYKASVTGPAGQQVQVNRPVPVAPVAPVAPGLQSGTAPRTTQLFDLVESALSNERAKFINAGNELINSLPAKAAPETLASIGALDKDMATAETRERVEKAMAAIDGLDKEDIAPKARASIEALRKNLTQFEADGAVTSLIALARRAKREDQKLIIGLETDWIPGISVEGSLQRQAISALMKEIDGIAEALQSMGLDNVKIVRGSASQLAGSLITTAKDNRTDMRNIVVMASNSTINSESFSPLRNADEDNRPFLAGIDPAELIKLYEEFGEDSSHQLYIRLTGLLYMTLELAAGKEPPQTPTIVYYDKKLRIVIFLPRAEPIDYETLKNKYKAETMALQAA
jgi:hypothetical protein